MPASSISRIESDQSIYAPSFNQNHQGLPLAATKLASNISPDLLFSLGVRTESLAALVRPMQQLKSAQAIDQLPCATDLGNALPCQTIRGDFSAPSEHVSLNSLARLLERFRGVPDPTGQLAKVCASLIKSSEGLQEITAFQLIHAHELLRTVPVGTSPLIDAAEDKLKAHYLQKIRINPMTFNWAPDEWKGDFHIALAAAKLNGNALGQMPDAFKDNIAIVSEAVKQAAESIQFASPRLRDHEAIGILAVSRFGPTLFYLSNNLKNNPKVVRVAMQENGMALQHASNALRRDPSVTSVALRQNPRAAQYVL